MSVWIVIFHLTAGTAAAPVDVPVIMGPALAYATAAQCADAARFLMAATRTLAACRQLTVVGVSRAAL